ncbi:hypothetical protein AALA61_13165 [Oscillospiraceae bacterium 42-9]
MNKKEQYEKILSQEYGISDIEQLITQYRCKVEISIFCAPQHATKLSKGLAASTHECVLANNKSNHQ